jgi:hypothetical protein
MGACVVVGWFIGHSSTPEPTPTAAPAPAVTETVVVEKHVPDPTVPASCERALESMLKILDQADTVAGHDGQQLDIMSNAYQAIYQKDWKRLNDLSDKQRRLWFDLTEETRVVLPEIPDIQKDVEQCRQEGQS